jgi:hypothetical protein
MTTQMLIFWFTVMGISIAFILILMYITVMNNIWCRCGKKPVLREFNKTFYYSCYDCGHIGKTGKTKQEAKKNWKS